MRPLTVSARGMRGPAERGIVLVPRRPFILLDIDLFCYPLFFLYYTNSPRIHSSIMKFSALLALLAFAISTSCDNSGRKPLTYASVPDGTYVPPKNSSIITLLDFVKSRDDLTTLASVLAECGGKFPVLSRFFSRLLTHCQAFFKHLILQHRGHTLSLLHQTRHSKILAPTSPPMLQHQKGNGGWAT